MNPFVSRISRASWEIPVSLLSLVLGVMLSLAWINEQNRPSRIPRLGVEQGSRVTGAAATEQPAKLDEKVSSLSSEVSRLRAENTRLQNAIADESKQGKVLNESLQEVKLFAALTEVEGPGITVTLRDSLKSVTNTAPTDRIIHDIDVLKVVNECWASGAEAITVNNHRVSAGSSFRCAGPVIYVDGARIASPVVIRAIGDTSTLEGAVNLPGGVLEEIRQMDPDMVQIDKVKRFHFPPYTGPTARNLLTVPKEAK